MSTLTDHDVLGATVKPSRWQRGYSRPLAWWSLRRPLERDSILYSLAAVFALLLGLRSHEPAQWHWGYLAVGPYALVSLLALLTRRLPRATLVRLVLLAVVFVGAVAIPLGLETRWRQGDHGGGFAQPEVSVIERSGQFLSRGQDPYQTYDVNGHLVHLVRGVPAFESFFPYFPLMGVFGLPSSENHTDHGLTDARIIMTLMTLVIAGLALWRLRVSQAAKIAVAQVLLVLPTGALFLSTGGDDMPILALLLLGVAALQRRQTWLSGVSLGVAAAMKLTSWPLAAGALFVARTHEGKRSWFKMGATIAAIVLVTVVPYAIRAPRAFISNVFAFPLGLAGVSSPAASALPGHILASRWPFLGHVLTPATFFVGGIFVSRYLRRHWPLELWRLLGVLSVAFTVMICVASATRVGYVIYPLNFAIWASVLRRPLENSNGGGVLVEA